MWRARPVYCQRGWCRLCFFTIDQGLHGHAQEVKWTLGAQWDDVTYGLGGLHPDNVFMNTIGDHIAGSELPEMWVNSGNSHSRSWNVPPYFGL